MKVFTSQPFAIVYSLFEHEFLGYLIEAFAVQMSPSGQFTLQRQSLSLKNIREFIHKSDESDTYLVELLDALQPDVIIKKFYNRRISQTDFFTKVFDSTKGDQTLRDEVIQYLEFKKGEALSAIHSLKKNFFVMGNDGNPTWKKIELMEQPATVLFHFRRNQDNTHYFPTIKHQGQKLEFQYKQAILLCDAPAWMLLDNRLYYFAKNIDGHKLRPFLNKKFIIIPKNVEDTYYKKFIAPLVASFDVYAVGFDIRTEVFRPQAILTFSEFSQVQALSLFASSQATEVCTTEETEILFELVFQYGPFQFKATQVQEASVSVEKNGESYIFHRIKKDTHFEHKVMNLLRDSGLDLKHGKRKVSKKEALEWIDNYYDILHEHAIVLQQNKNDLHRYFVGKAQLSINITESNDWFDIQTKVLFGSHEIPFLQIRKYILEGKSEFVLPDGQIAIIPETWFTQFNDLFHFLQTSPHQHLLLGKQHLSLVQTLRDQQLAQVKISQKLENLKDFEKIKDYPLPAHFNGILRPYQKAGYNWMSFLGEYHLGGCLADDMGLGKTIQTLALLQAEQEKDKSQTSIIIVPTSLIYNWQLEAAKFVPKLKIFSYVGTQRNKKIANFSKYDVIITSYGIIRVDIDLLKNFHFNYIILDESQAIKNPSSNIASAIKELSAKNRIALTGTPIENTTLDLWSQMHFLNPGLLGSKTFFKKEYLYPIEKAQDTNKLNKLHATIKPFILRRTKSQVAQDLPEKIENIQYCSMTSEQEELYESTKSQYRNQILEQIEKRGILKTQFLLLKGLTALRQIANHPAMIDTTYTGDSGKMEDLRHKLDALVKEGRKALVFSQFVKHLSIVRTFLDQAAIPYAYLDGSSKDRQQQVEKFQTNPNVLVFLISLKAGGVGLNLTAAEYVFLLDPWWNPAIEAQAIDRAHRIGQKQTVINYKFITTGSVEEKILGLQQSKRKLAEHLIEKEKGFLKSLTKEDIDALLK